MFNSINRKLSLTRTHSLSLSLSIYVYFMYTTNSVPLFSPHHSVHYLALPLSLSLYPTLSLSLTLSYTLSLPLLLSPTIYPFPQACINMQDYPSAAQAASGALKEDPLNVKALYRRGLSRNHLGIRRNKEINP